MSVPTKFHPDGSKKSLIAKIKLMISKGKAAHLFSLGTKHKISAQKRMNSSGSTKAFLNSSTRS